MCAAIVEESEAALEDGGVGIIPGSTSGSSEVIRAVFDWKK
jgi:hypothetical protein